MARPEIPSLVCASPRERMWTVLSLTTWKHPALRKAQHTGLRAKHPRGLRSHHSLQSPVIWGLWRTGHLPKLTLQVLEQGTAHFLQAVAHVPRVLEHLQWPRHGARTRGCRGGPAEGAPQDKRATGGQHLAVAFLCGSLPGSLLHTPSPSLWAKTLHVQPERPTSCLSVSLAMISLWSMRDSSSTSSSD